MDVIVSNLFAVSTFDKIVSLPHTVNNCAISQLTVVCAWRG